jgi:PAS domain S-box-containing protein
MTKRDPRFADWLFILLQRFWHMVNPHSSQQAASESRFLKVSAFAQNATDAFFVCDQNGNIVDTNRRLEEFTGYGLDELVTLNLADLQLDLSPRKLKAFFRCLKKNGSVRIKRVAKGKDKSALPVEISLSNIPGEGNSSFLGVARLLEKESRELPDTNSIQVRKMEALGQIAAGVAHDFNNRLGVILGHASLLKKKTEGDESLLHSLDKIISASRQAADLAKQLLNFSRSNLERHETVDIHRCLGNVIALLEHGIDKRIEIRPRFGAERCQVAGDRSQLENIFFNIAINACDAMPEGGTLSFRTMVENLPHEIDGETCKHVCIEISDTGKGIPDHIIGEIFKPFFTTKGPEKGTGLGLSIAYTTVKRHKGNIGVESAPGVGTKFTVSLPLVKNDSTRFLPKKAEKVIEGSGNILVVDDEQSILEMAEESLQCAGYQVTCCQTGREALKIFAKKTDGFDIVVLDMMMPVMSGEELFREMKQIKPGIKVLLTSGYSRGGMVEKALAAGADGFIRKPYDIFELSRKVAQILSRK